MIDREKDIDIFVDLGLGRGVDGTNPTPWLNKSSFQVREVTFKNIIGTEEGDLYQGFVNEVESTQHLQTNLSASVPVSHLVSLGIDSELSRSYSVNQKSVGKKVITRTISFRADFDDIVNSGQTATDGAAGEEEDEEDEGDDEEEKGEANKEERRKTFETRLTDWILQQKKEEDEFGHQKNEKEDENEANSLVASKLKDKKKDIFANWKEKDLLEHCYRFVNTFSITHYVYTLELGASHYRVMSEEDYRTKISSKANLGVGKMADIAIGSEGRFGTRKFSSKATKVGHMVKTDDLRDTVKRGETDEAVVGVKLQPISSLVVESAKLRRALQDALQRFINDKQNIKCKVTVFTHTHTHTISQLVESLGYVVDYIRLHIVTTSLQPRLNFDYCTKNEAVESVFKSCIAKIPCMALVSNLYLCHTLLCQC